MMKLVTLSLLVVLAVSVTAGDHKTESGWFDMDNCVFCKNLMEDPNLLPHSTWESHKIANGGMEIMTVAPEYAESFERAGKAMEAIGNKMMSGEMNPMTVEMCGHCKMFGQTMMAGAKVEMVEGEAAYISLTTSDDPAVVAMIHKMVDRDIAEMKLMMAGGDHGNGHDHSGHEHHE